MNDLVPGSWECYRQLIWDEHIAHSAEFPARALTRPFDPEVRAAAGVLGERFRVLAPRIADGAGDGDLVREAEELLRDQEALRDQRCARDTRDWEDLQRRCGDLMVFLARITTWRGRAGEAREWFTRSAATWQELGDRAWAEECLLGAAEASLADGSDVDAVLEILDSWIGERPPPVWRARLLARTARILLHAGDHMGARQRADEAARALNSAGFTDPVAAGSAEDAFAVWVSAAHREITAGLPWLQTQSLFSAVATIWEALIEMRFPLGTLPRAQALRGVDDIHALRSRLLRDAAAVARRVQQAAVAGSPSEGSTTAAVTDGGAESRDFRRSYEDVIGRQYRLNALGDEARQAGGGNAELDSLLDRLAALETEALHAADVDSASLAAIEKARALSGAGRCRARAVAACLCGGRLMLLQRRTVMRAIYCAARRLDPAR